jgi:hypothetical protein
MCVPLPHSNDYWPPKDATVVLVFDRISKNEPWLWHIYQSEKRAFPLDVQKHAWTFGSFTFIRDARETCKQEGWVVINELSRKP